MQQHSSSQEMVKAFDQKLGKLRDTDGAKKAVKKLMTVANYPKNRRSYEPLRENSNPALSATHLAGLKKLGLKPK